jgi:protein-S-isoprenylcysteine O-methyltransferase Ste14
MSPPTHESTGVIAPRPFIFCVRFGAAFAFQRLYSLNTPPLYGNAVWTGMALIYLSGLLAFWAAFYMWRARTPINPLRPTRALVVSGPYHFSRNPLSHSLVILYVGMALRLNTLWPLLLMPPLLALFHYGVIQREERYLEEKFGNEYRDYCSAVRRWF